MNPLIKQQLLNCKVANIPPFNDETTEIRILKVDDSIASLYEVHKCYLVELLFDLNDSVLASNWNHGSFPTYKYYTAEIVQVVGDMVKISGCGYDVINNVSTNDMWEGWAPRNGLKLLQELK